MGYLPAPAFAPAQTVVASDWNTYVRDNLKTLASKCLLYQGASIALGAGATGAWPSGTQLYDSADDMANPSTFRITAKQAGTYRVRARVGAPTGGGWTWFVRLNGTTTLFGSTVLAGQEVTLDWPTILAVSDFLELCFTVGGTNVTSSAAVVSAPSTVFAFLAADWVGP